MTEQSPVPSHEDSQETPKVDPEKCDGCEFRNRFGLHLMRDGRRLCAGCLVKIPNHWDQRERRRQTAPTAWAYQQADAAVWKHRTRADAAEAECSRLRAENERLRKGELEIEECAETLVHREVERQWEARNSRLREALETIGAVVQEMRGGGWARPDKKRQWADKLSLLLPKSEGK